MALEKVKLKELIQESFRKNDNLKFDISYVRGISNNKEIMETKADVDQGVIHKFYVVNPGEFVYNPRTTRMGNKVGLGFNNSKTPLLFSFNNIAFFIKDEAKEKILPEYLYMYFNRGEFDRYAMTNGWGSATELFGMDEMYDIEIELPDIETQRKFVNIYLSMLENQKSYERGLEDLKLVCDGYIEDLRRKMQCDEIGQYIEERSEKNSDGKITNVLGISKEGFIDPRANMDGVSLTNYNVFYKNDFVYSPPRINVGSIGLYKEETVSICSPIYNVFYVKNSEKLLPDYLMMWFKRSEFLRSTDFYSIGSVRNNFDMDCMKEVKIPIPSIEIQQSIVNIFRCYLERKRINEQLKTQIKDICPILIKGSIEEAKVV